MTPTNPINQTNAAATAGSAQVTGPDTGTAVTGNSAAATSNRKARPNKRRRKSASKKRRVAFAKVLKEADDEYKLFLLAPGKQLKTDNMCSDAASCGTCATADDDAYFDVNDPSFFFGDPNERLAEKALAAFESFREDDMKADVASAAGGN